MPIFYEVLFFIAKLIKSLQNKKWRDSHHHLFLHNLSQKFLAFEPKIKSKHLNFPNNNEDDLTNMDCNNTIQISKI